MPNFKRVIIIPAVLVCALGFGIYKGWDWYQNGRFIVSTDDAYVKADNAIISAKISGYIAEIFVKDNQSVAAGSLLLRLDDGDYKLAEQAAHEKIMTQDATIARIGEQVKAQSAQIAQAEASLASAQSDLRRAEAFFSRSDALMKEKISSQASFDVARADRDRALATLSAAQAALSAAEAGRLVAEAQKNEAQKLRSELQIALEKTKRDRTFTEIKAPFAGVIGNKAAQTGAFIQPGTRLMALIPLDGVYIEANFKETQIAKLKVGQKVYIIADAFANEPIEGQLTSIAPAAGSQFSLLPPDNATGNFTKIVQRVPVKIEIPPQAAAKGQLRPGMSVEVKINAKADGIEK